MHQTVLHHIVISSQRPHADRLLLKPNASLQLLSEAGARHERTLEAVSCKALFGEGLATDSAVVLPPPQ
jgi:hypothetical protein